MALAEWRKHPGELEQEELDHLAVAWMRRKKLEARLIANELARVLTGTPESSPATVDEAWEEFEAAAEG